jgi:cytochrome c556
MRKMIVLAGAMIAMTGVAVSVAAQDKAAVVKKRQDTMKQQAANLKYIANFAKGVSGDQTDAGYKVDELQFISGKLLSLFPPGTSSADLPNVKTYAKPEIWTDYAEFKTIPPRVADLETALGDAVRKGDKRAILVAIGNLGKNGCGACHSKFREKLPQE